MIDAQPKLAAYDNAAESVLPEEVERAVELGTNLLVDFNRFTKQGDFIIPVSSDELDKLARQTKAEEIKRDNEDWRLK